MPLPPGARLGPYEVLSPLGAGGMGEVYRARDSRLQRDVAIKVLAGSFSAEPERLARFEQEARAAAALNHPNILAVFDLGQHDGAPFIVSEVLDGTSLRAVLQQGVLPARRAIDYGVQIALGMAAAHDRGIVHRDLKPDNVFVTSDGRIKILDFGLAKLTQPEVTAAGMSVLPTTPAFTAIPNTGAGIVMGTMGYMSPEQVRGGVSDHRSDIFALGVVLYEMLSGRRAFAGDTAVDTMSAILKEDPPELPVVERHIPPALARIVSRCLEKNPAARFQSARDLAFALEALTTQSGSTATAALPSDAVVRAKGAPGRSQLVAWGVAAVALLAAAGIAAIHFREAPAARRTVKFQIAPPGPTAAEMLAVSRDGRSLAFVAIADGPAQIWVRSIDSVEARPLPGTDGATYPFWSPDGSYIAFFAQGKLRKIATAGGPPITLCDSPTGRGGSWNDDGVIIFSSGPTSPIVKVSASGGTPTPVTSLPAGDNSAGARFPSFLPDGKHFLYFATSGGKENGIYVASLDGGAPVELSKDPSNAIYAVSGGAGYLLFRRDETLMAQPFDTSSRTLSGEAFPLAEHVPLTQNNGFGAFSASWEGTLVFRSGDSGLQELAWFTRQGVREKAVTKPQPITGSPVSLSPDQKKVAYSLVSGESRELWLHDLGRDVATRFTFAAGTARNAVWSPDGTMIYYSFVPQGAASNVLIRKPASGGGSEERLIETGVNGFITDISPDGRFAVFNRTGPKTDLDLWLLPLQGEKKAVPFLQTPFNEGDAVFAPRATEGQWVAYSSNESGRFEIYLQPVPATGVKYQVSTAGGENPYWRGDGRELYYIQNSAIFAVPIALGAHVEIGTPQQLFRNPVAGSYVPAADGQRFLLAVPAGGISAVPQATAILNWK